jgi:hypothetical protein
MAHKTYYSDKLVTRSVDRAEGTTRYQFRAKRVGKDCPLTRSERMQYVRHGAGCAIRAIRANRAMGLRAAQDLLAKAAGRGIWEF